MFLKLLTLLIVVPLLELYVLIKIGSIIGALNTVFVVVLTAFLGAFLTKREGLKVLYQIKNSLENGLMPAEEILDGFLIFVAGAMLVTPGFITDSTGFFLLFPVTRQVAKKFIVKTIKKNFFV